MKKLILLSATILFLLTLQKLQATNPIALEAYEVELSENLQTTHALKSYKLSEIKRKVQYLIAKKIASFKNADKLAKIAFIFSLLSILLVVILLITSFPLFLVAVSSLLAGIGIIMGIIVLLKSKTLSDSKKNIKAISMVEYLNAICTLPDFFCFPSLLLLRVIPINIQNAV